MSRPGLLSSTEKAPVDISVTVDDDEFLTEAEDVRPMHVETQRIVDLALLVFIQVPFHPRSKEIVIAKVLLLENADSAAVKTKNVFNEAVENGVRRVVTQVVFNTAIIMKTDNLDERRELVQHLTSNFIKICHSK